MTSHCVSCFPVSHVTRILFGDEYEFLDGFQNALDCAIAVAVFEVFPAAGRAGSHLCAGSSNSPGTAVECESFCAHLARCESSVLVKLFLPLLATGSLNRAALTLLLLTGDAQMPCDDSLPLPGGTPSTDCEHCWIVCGIPAHRDSRRGRQLATQSDSTGPAR